MTHVREEHVDDDVPRGMRHLTPGRPTPLEDSPAALSSLFLDFKGRLRVGADPRRVVV